MQSRGKLSLIAPFPSTPKCGGCLSVYKGEVESVSVTFCYPASNILLKDRTDKSLQMRQTAEQPVTSPLLGVRPHKIFEGQDESLRPWLIASRQRFRHLNIIDFLFPFLFHMAFLCRETRRGGKRKKRDIKGKHFI